mmetsp:Transcript_29793/g.40907  ORF Transcript_29793/g.40907 Transcript_29793/m.40907 type:complete len:1150 (+) Transcript_29793:1094-4543(+)
MHDIILCKSIYHALISIGYLTKVLKLFVFYSDDKAFILERVCNKEVDEESLCYFRTIATAQMQSDGLFHVDDMTKFLLPLRGASESTSTTSSLPSLNFTISMKSYIDREIKYGGAKVFIKSSRQYLTLLQWLHVRLGHINESQLKWMVKHQSVLGSGVSWSDIKDLQLGMCDTCIRAKMRAFALPCSISHKVYEVFEHLSSDYKPFCKTVNGVQVSFSVRGYTGVILYTDKASDKVFCYLVKSSSEWLSTLILCIKEYGPGANPRSIKPRYLMTDFASEVHSKEFTKFIQDNDIRLDNSAPYKHAQNPVERKIQTISNMMRATLIYNLAPIRYWCYGIMYTVQTHNMICSTGNTRTRNEDFSGEKSDISSCVPFYSHGWAAISDEERKTTDTGTHKTLKDRSVQVIMLGYTQPYPIPDKSESTPYIKNGFICYVPSQNKIMPRHDCIWNSTEETALSNPEPNTSNESDNVTTSEEEFDYDLLGITSDENPSWDADLVKQTSLPLITDDVTVVAPVIDRPPSSDFAAITPMETLKNPQRNDDTIELPTPPSDTRAKRTVKTTTKFAQYLNSRKPKAVANNTQQKPAVKQQSPLTVPTTLFEALTSPDASNWREAWETEMTRLAKRHSWDEIKIGEEINKAPIKSKYAFRVTVRPNGTLKYRCRLVACGYSQIKGDDYDATFAPTAKYRSLCIILHLAAVFGWDIQGIDFELAFLESDIDKEIYMTLPKDVYIDSINGKPVVVRLRKSLYGLKQAGELWYQLVNNLLVSYGYTRIIHDQCVYIKRDPTTGKVTIIICYVDDLLFVGNCPTTISNTIAHLLANVTNLTEMGEVKRYIGVDIKRDLERHTISLSQKPYIDKFIDEVLTEYKSSKPIPMSDQIDFSKEGDGSIEPIQDKVGQIRYMADKCRPDILTTAGILGSAATKPTKAHLKGIEHLARYLQGTKDDEIVLGGMDETVKLFGYTDASHLPDNSSKPRLGYCFFLNLTSGTIHARSIKDTTVSHSSCESEIKAIDAAIRQTIWLRGFLDELGFTQNEPTVLYTDSQSAKALADIFKIGSNSAHLVMRINYIHECIESGIVRLKYINTFNEVADILTKLLPVQLHERHTDFLLRGHNFIEPTTVVKPVVVKSNFKFNSAIGKFVHKLNKVKTKQ